MKTEDNTVTAEECTVTAEERIEKVQGALQRRFRIAGRGSVSEVQQHLNLGTGYFKNQRRTGRRRVDLKVLFRALEALEVDSAEFFASVLGSADPLDSFKSEAAALRRKVRYPMILTLVAKRSATATDEVDLTQLDALRTENPRQVLRQTKTLVLQVQESQLSALLAIHASACRGLAKLEEAQIVLVRALELAAERGDAATSADILQRISFVLSYRGDQEEAMAISERATLAFVTHGDLAGAGKTMIDRGSFLMALGRSEEGLQTFHNALRYLPAQSERSDLKAYRFAGLTNLGVSYRKSKDLEKARHFAAQAREVSDGVGQSSIGKLIWLQASIAKECGRYEEAERFYREALEILRPVEPIDAAIAAIELVRTLLDQGRSAEAYTTAKAMAMLLQSLEHNRVAASLVTELIRCALTGRGLTAAFLAKIARGLDKGRAQQGTAPARRSRR